MKYYEFLYELLAKQYELARIDEARDATIIQVMDKAIEPDFRTKPKRARMVLISTMAAGFVAVVLAFLSDVLKHARQNPEHARRWGLFRGYLRIRRTT